MTKHSPQTIAAAVREGARLVESGNWKACDQSGRLFSGWLVGCIFTGDSGLDYAARTAFAEWWTPGEFRNDGLRINETAGDRGIRIGRAATAAAMRQFCAMLDESALAG